RLRRAAQTLLAVFSAGLALAARLDEATVGPMYVLTLRTATASCFDEQARQALIPNLVPRDRLAHATTLNILSHDVAAVIGPAVGGVAISQIGIAVTYTFDAISFGAVIAAL